MSNRRVVVTGMGAVTPFGIGVDPLWEGLVDGRNGIRPVSLFDTSGFPVRFGGEIPDFNPTPPLERKLVKRLDRYAQFALVAAEQAMRLSGLDVEQEDPTRIATVFGTGIGGLNELEEQHTRLMTKGPSKVSAFTIPRLMVNAASGNISIHFGLKGNSIAVSSACASATHAIGEAMRYVRHGDADVVITGGAEAALTPLALSAFASMKALSTRNDDPTAASRPFDRDRDGFVLSEGAGAFIIENLEHATKRGAIILAELVGFGASSDADHLTQPLDTGDGAALAMGNALRDAQYAPDKVDYVNAHGTGTPLGDLAETLALKSVFGDHARSLVVSSTKGAVGHSLGASGAVESVACILAIKNNVIPPTINLDHPGDGCDLDYCPKTARDHRIDVALNNSFGFGGHNACLLIRRFD